MYLFSILKRCDFYLTSVTWHLVMKCFVLALSNASSGFEIGMLLEDSGYPKPGDIPILNRKVFKGRRVSIREHPYVVSIRRHHAHYLVGTLMTKNLVITVAHPLVDVPITELGIVLGENYCDRGTFVATVLLLFVPKSFDPYTLKNDIAMIRIYEEINYKFTVKPISMISDETDIEGRTAFVTGWGRCDNSESELCLYRSSKYFPDERLDPMLRSISFTVSTSDYFCNGYKRHEVPIFDGMMCTGPAREDDPSCPCLAVPGAPLVVGAYLVGLLSWGFGCGYAHDLPLIYTSVRDQANWILSNVVRIKNIKQANLTQLYNITKAYHIAEWFKQTREIKPTLNIRKDKSMEPLDLDKLLCSFPSKVYDVRDFINDNMLRNEKQIMYAALVSAGREMLKAKMTTKKPTTPRLHLQPFLSNRTNPFQDVWFPNKNNQNKEEILTRVDSSSGGEDSKNKIDSDVAYSTTRG